jgi:hypothetical protein
MVASTILLRLNIADVLVRKMCDLCIAEGDGGEERLVFY